MFLLVKKTYSTIHTIYLFRKAVTNKEGEMYLWKMKVSRQWFLHSWHSVTVAGRINRSFLKCQVRFEKS